MKRYRIRKGSPMETILPVLALMALIMAMGLGGHFIDGI